MDAIYDDVQRFARYNAQSHAWEYRGKDATFFRALAETTDACEDSYCYTIYADALEAMAQRHILEQIPPHILRTLQEMLGRIGEFNQTVERVRGIGARFGDPGRYEYEFRTDKEEAQLAGPLRFLHRFETQCALKGIDPQAVYAALIMRPDVIPWSDAARNWR